MAYILQDGKASEIGVLSVCADLSYAQAEVIFISERLRKENPNSLIVGDVEHRAEFTVTHFLEAYSKDPAALKRIEELRAAIKSKGFQSFTLKAYHTDFQQFLKRKPTLELGRCVDQLVDTIARFRDLGNNDDIKEMIEDIYANPLHAGVHVSFPATVQDEVWISDATKSIRRITPDRWLRRMIAVLRSYFKGQPKTPLPTKLDRCPCGSSKKYGKCCGYGVEAQDPEECKLGRHEYSPWNRLSAKCVRTCARCYRLQEAPWTEDFTIDEMSISLIGCPTCPGRPTDDQIASEIEAAAKWNVCGICNKRFTINKVLIQHDCLDKKRTDKWMAGEVLYKEKSLDVESKMLGKRLFIHKDCFVKAFPAWDDCARNIPKNDEEIAVEIPVAKQD